MGHASRQPILERFLFSSLSWKYIAGAPTTIPGRGNHSRYDPDRAARFRVGKGEEALWSADFWLPGLALAVAISPASILGQTSAPLPRGRQPRRTTTPRHRRHRPAPRSSANYAATGQPLPRARHDERRRRGKSTECCHRRRRHVRHHGSLGRHILDHCVAIRISHRAVRPAAAAPIRAHAGVNNGEVAEHIDLALFDGAVLDGRILDVAGDPVQENDPEFLESLRAASTTFELAEGRSTTLTLKIALDPSR